MLFLYLKRKIPKTLNIKFWVVLANAVKIWAISIRTGQVIILPNDNFSETSRISQMISILLKHPALLDNS